MFFMVILTLTLNLEGYFEKTLNAVLEGLLNQCLIQTINCLFSTAFIASHFSLYPFEM